MSKIRHDTQIFLSKNYKALFGKGLKSLECNEFTNSLHINYYFHLSDFEKSLITTHRGDEFVKRIRETILDKHYSKLEKELSSLLKKKIVQVEANTNYKTCFTEMKIFFD